MSDIKLIDRVNIPAYALVYLINGEADGLDRFDIDEIHGFIERLGRENNAHSFVYACQGDSCFFSHSPAFGLPCMCAEVDIYGYENEPMEE